MERSFRCLPSSSALDLLEGLPVFQIWRECRQIFGVTNLRQKIEVRIFCFRLRRLKTLVLKHNFVSEVVPFVRYCHIYCIQGRNIFRGRRTREMFSTEGAIYAGISQGLGLNI